MGKLLTQVKEGKRLSANEELVPGQSTKPMRAGKGVGHRRAEPPDNPTREGSALAHDHAARGLAMTMPTSLAGCCCSPRVQIPLLAPASLTSTANA